MSADDRVRIHTPDINLNSDNDLSRKVQAEMLALLYRHTPAAIFGTSFAVIIIWIVFGRATPTLPLLLWTMVLMSVLGWRFLLFHRYKNSAQSVWDIDRLESLAITSAGSTGICLGVGAFIIASNSTPFYQGALLVFMLGFVVSAIPFLGAVKKAYFFYSIGATLPVMIWCVLNQHPVYLGTAALVILFIWSAWITSEKYRHNIESSIRSRYKLGEVTGAKEALQQSYEKLASAEQLVRHSEERFRGIFESGLFGMAILDNDGVVQRVNHAFCHFIGYQAMELVGRDYGELVHPDSREHTQDALRSATKGNQAGQQYETQYRHKDGRDVYGLTALTSIRGDKGDTLGIVIQTQDITKEKGIRKQLAYQASHDELTGLINRREFQNRLQSVVNSGKDSNARHSLCYVDLDNFKIVNDTFGHASGDAILKQIANILRSSIRGSDTLARLGGDEFGIILENCDVEAATKISEDFIAALNNTDFVWNDHHFHIQASVGLVMISRESRDIAELMKQADLACYTAKDLGGDQVYLFPLLTENSTHYSDIIRAVQWMGAFLDDRLCLYAQPIIPLQTNDQVSPWYEVLLRVKTNDGNVVSPRLLIPAADRYGQMASIDRWVIDKTFKEFRALNQNNDIRLSINLSGTSISSSDLSAYIEDKLDEYDVSAECICFELTETAAVKSVEQVLSLMNNLKQRGCQFSLDDFGSGLSSFKYLKQFPFDSLKIDGSLIHDISDDPNDYAMVKAIQQLSSSLGLVCVAEWVCNRDVSTIVTSLGIEYGQGFFYGDPIPLKDIVDYHEDKSLVSIASAG